MLYWCYIALLPVLYCHCTGIVPLIGVIRSVALGSTDGLCTWICTYLLGLQPVIVPAGRMSLGRIFNVVGAIIDRYLGLSLSSQFNILIPCAMDNDLGMFIESHEQYASTLCYLKTLYVLLMLVTGPLLSIILLDQSMLLHLWCTGPHRHTHTHTHANQLGSKLQENSSSNIENKEPANSQ